jgi:CarboxypepD_reg-like domain
MAKRHKNISPDDLQNYVAGSLTPTQQHSIERDIHNEPFWNEAAEGFEALKKDNIDPKPHFNDLHARLNARITKEQKKTVAWWQNPQLLRWAATIALVSGVASWFLYKPTQPTPEITQIQPKQRIETKKEEIAEKPINELIKKEETLAQHTKSKKPDIEIIDNSWNKDADKYSAKTEKTTEAISAAPLLANDSVPKTISVAPAAAPAGKSVITIMAKETQPIILGKGVVVDENGRPLSGISIGVVKSKIGANTNVNGEFEIKNLSPKDSIQLSYVGYKTLKIPVNNGNFGKLSLVQDTQMLSEVVVVGSQQQKTKSIVGAVDKYKVIDLSLPEPTGGWGAYDDYLAESLSKLVGKGEVELMFYVRKNGHLSKIKIISSNVAIPADSLAKITKKSPKFNPARNRKGHAIKKTVKRKVEF